MTPYRERPAHLRSPWWLRLGSYLLHFRFCWGVAVGGLLVGLSGLTNLAVDWLTPEPPAPKVSIVRQVDRAESGYPQKFWLSCIGVYKHAETCNHKLELFYGAEPALYVAIDEDVTVPCSESLAPPYSKACRDAGWNPKAPKAKP